MENNNMKLKLIKGCVELLKENRELTEQKILSFIDVVSKVEKSLEKLYSDNTNILQHTDILGEMKIGLLNYHYGENPNLTPFVSVDLEISLERHNPITLIFEDFNLLHKREPKPFYYELLRFMDNCHISISSDKKEAKQLVLKRLNLLYKGEW